MSNAPNKILELVEKYERGIGNYRSSSYNETQVRREFIDPMFGALGWDVDNSMGLASGFTDVITELWQVLSRQEQSARPIGALNRCSPSNRGLKTITGTP